MGNRITNLAKLIETKKLTRKDFANKVGITESALSRYINGSRIPRGEHLIKIAEVLGVTIEEIIDKDYGNDKSLIAIIIKEKQLLIDKYFKVINIVKEIIPLLNKLNRQNDTVKAIRQKCEEIIS